MKLTYIKAILLLCTFLITLKGYANSLEVLHWWTAPGEFEAQNILKDSLARQGVSWRDFAIVGSGGASALRVLQMRALSGNPPDVAQIKGPDITEWAKMGMLQDVDNIIANPQWQQHLPDVIQETIRYQQHYMALPVNIHRVNWLWLNKAIFDELDLSPPTTWQAFFEVADKIEQAGYIALAHGGTRWQDSLLFESVVLSLLGAKKYRQAFVYFDESVLTSAQMIAAFKQFKRLNQYVDNSLRGKDWVVASDMLIEKKAAMLLMGDWAKGMWQAAGKVAMQDYLCVDVPESKHLFSYNIDSFVFFKKAHDNNVSSEIFAQTLLSKPFQYAFNLQKGSLPVRSDMNMSMFDACTQKAYHDFNHSELVPSFSQNMASSSYLQREINKIISDYFKNDHMSAEQASKQLALTIRAVNK